MTKENGRSFQGSIKHTASELYRGFVVKRGRPKRGEGINGNERSLWNYAIRNDLLPKFLGTGLLNDDELDTLQFYFEGETGAQKPPETVLDKLSLGVARSLIPPEK